ncbi:MAG: hypothetical protein K2V38_28470, partial [Gemmataceae bacterium]|nr:hypothetical protein [Gemmataceae bacterium]
DLRYQVFPDLIAVSFLWLDGFTPRQELPNEFRTTGEKGYEVGFRLWHPEHRGLPPVEKPKDEPDAKQPEPQDP